MRWQVQTRTGTSQTLRSNLSVVECSECSYAMSPPEDPNFNLPLIRQMLNVSRTPCPNCDAKPPRFRQAIVKGKSARAVQDVLPATYRAFPVPEGVLVAGFEEDDVQPQASLAVVFHRYGNKVEEVELS